MAYADFQEIDFSWIDDLLERLAEAVLGLKPKPVPVAVPQKRVNKNRVR